MGAPAEFVTAKPAAPVDFCTFESEVTDALPEGCALRNRPRVSLCVGGEGGGVVARECGRSLAAAVRTEAGRLSDRAV